MGRFCFRWGLLDCNCMSFKFTQKLAGYTLLGAVFAFAIYSNVRLAIRNYEFKQTIVSSQLAVDEMKKRTEKLELLLTFYETSEYQEVEAKRRLGLKRKDETAVLVNGLPANSLAETLEDFVYREPTPPAPEVESNFQKWLKYLRGSYRKG